MPTTYTNGLKLPDLGSIDWYNSYKNNIDILDPIVGTVNGVATTYAPISHNHSASEITSGTIDIARLPPAALERMHIVADQTARYALTTSTVQEGDTVKQTDTGVMYLVVDSTKLNSADGYTEYSAGTASKAIADEDGTSIKTGYVNVAGNQTVSGQKTWSGVNYFNNENLYQTATNPRYAFKSSILEIGVQPSGHCTATVDWLDNNDVELGYSRFVEYNNSIQTYEVLLKNKAENDSLSPAGNDISASLQLALFKTGSSQLNIGADTVAPTSNNSASLGTSSYQWSSVYAQSYYYNGTQWGLDKANVWSGYNTFTNYIALQESAVIPAGGYGKGIAFRDYQNNRLGYIQPHLTSNSEKRILIGADSGDIASNSNIIPNANNAVNLGSSSYQWSSVYAQSYYYNGTAWGLDKSNLWTGNNTFKSANTNFRLQSTSAETGSTTASSNWMHWIDKNGYQDAYISRDFWNNGADTLRIVLSGKRSNGAPSTSGTAVECGIRLDIAANGSKSVNPYTNGDTDLGTSAIKFKTLNGINPGALSLPNLDSDGYVDLSGNISANTQYTYTAPSDGWLCLYVQTSGFHAENAVAIFNGAGTADSHRWANSAVSSINLLRMGVYHGAVSVPVRAGNAYLCYVKVDSSTSLSRTFFYFYKAQGNV